MKKPSKPPMISVIIPVKNGAHTIEACLNSILKQDFKNYEIIVVDNFSDDLTPEICRAYNLTFLQQGPERNTQRQYGFNASKGEIALFLDADMKIAPGLLAEAARLFLHNTSLGALIIPEIPFGAPNYWSRCKVLERSLYDGDDQIEAARFFSRVAYNQVGGHDLKMIAMEDWDLMNRVRAEGFKIKRTHNKLWHNEGYVTLANIWRKKYYYGQESVRYTQKNGWKEVLSKVYFFRPVFWQKRKIIWQKPHVALGMFMLLSVELLAGGLGLLSRKIS